jgi:hypothetical protein
VRAKGQPDLWPGDARARESFRSHTDHRELFAVDPNGSAKHARIGAASLPEWITDDRDTHARTQPFFLRRERASKSQRQAKGLEVVGRHGGRQRAARPLANVQTGEDRGIGRQVREDVDCAFSKIDVVGVREAPILSGRRRAAAVYPHHFVGAFVQRPQQQAVDEAEHADVDADAERKGHDRREREPGTAA